jgi:hypothetical protein
VGAPELLRACAAHNSPDLTASDSRSRARNPFFRHVPAYQSSAEARERGGNIDGNFCWRNWNNKPGRALSVLGPLYTHCGGPETAQRPLAKEIGISLTLFRKLDDSAGDQLAHAVVAVRNSQGYASHLECDPQDALRLGIESVAV